MEMTSCRPVENRRSTFLKAFTLLALILAAYITVRHTPARHYLDGEVLLPSLDPVDRALAGSQRLGELRLGEPAVRPGVPDEGADLRELEVGGGGGGRGHGQRLSRM